MIRRHGAPGIHGIGGIAVADFGASCPAAAGNGLLNNLIAFWPGNEANGDALDLHTNALHLTDVNTVTSAAGLVYATARQYTAVSGEYHIRPGDDALLSCGDVEMTLAAWVYIDSKADRTIAGKWTTAAGARGYRLDFNNAADRFIFYVRNMADAASGSVTAATFGSPALSAWILVLAWHDPTANTLNIQINNGVVDTTAAWAGGILDDTTAFQISGYAGISNRWNGRIGPTMFWKSAAGGGGVLTAAQRTALYNAGAGLTYAQFTT